MDLVLKLREARRLRGLTQREAADRSGVGVKTISSFETGERIESMTLVHLQKLLRVYDLTEAEFFSPLFERAIAPWLFEAKSELAQLVEDVETLPSDVQRILIDKVRVAVDVARAVLPEAFRARDGEARRPVARLSA
jgi:transcriptional regulator with XRE-family HTH domain